MALSQDFMEQLHKAYEKAESDRLVYDWLWQELADYILPRKSNIARRFSPGSKLTERVFDSTAGHANQILAANIHGAMSNPVLKWFGLRCRNRDVSKIVRVRDWLEQCANEMFIAIQESNFNSEINEVYLDLGAFGIGALLVEEQEISTSGFNGLQFKSLSLGDYSIAENPLGFVDTIFFKFTWKLKDVVQKWGNEVLNEDMQHSFNSGQWNKEIDIVHAVFPREGIFPDTEELEKPFASVYYACKEKHIFSEGGYDEFPCMVPRWSKANGEIYGRGPGDTARPDIRSLNKAKQMDLKSWAKEIDPPMTALQNSVIGGVVRLSPGAVNIVTDHQALQALSTTGSSNAQRTMLKVQELQTSIRQIFFNDQLQLPDKVIITATEVLRRLELMNRVLGPTIGRLNRELYSPMLNRVFGMMYRTSALPEAPQEFLEAVQANKADTFIEYEGLLARAQRSQEVDAVERFYVVAAPMINVRPEVLDNLDDDGLFRDLAEQVGMPAKYMREVDQVQEIRAAREQAAQEQAELQRAMAEAEVAHKISGAASNMQGAPQETFQGEAEEDLEGVF